MVKVLLFGILAEKAGRKEAEACGGQSLSAVIEELNASFPGLLNVKYKVAVNKTLVSDINMEVPDGAEVALLPPFSGG